MLMRSDPFREFHRLTEQMWRGRGGMAMDAYRTGDEFVVLIDLPGIDPGSIHRTVERDMLMVAARYLTRAFPESHSLRCGPGRCTAVGPVSFGQWVPRWRSCARSAASTAVRGGLSRRDLTHAARRLPSALDGPHREAGHEPTEQQVEHERDG